MVKQRRSDAELIRRARSGDQDAWAALVDRYSRLAYAVPLQLGLSPDSSANIFHNVYRLLLENLDNVRDTKSLVNWLLHTTVNEVRRLRGGVMVSPRVDAISSIEQSPFSEETVEQWLQQQTAREATQQLSERCQRLLDAVLYTQDPPPKPELARRLNIPESRVSAEQALCFESLLDVLEAWDFE